MVIDMLILEKLNELVSRVTLLEGQVKDLYDKVDDLVKDNDHRDEVNRRRREGQLYH